MPRLTSLLCLLLLLPCFGQADERYVFGFLRVHPERTELPEVEAMRIQKEHLAHLDSMAKAGYLVGAGPLMNSKDLRGILIFRGLSREEAVAKAVEDPAVKAKRLRVHLENWSGPPDIGKAVAESLKATPARELKMTQFGAVVNWKQPAAIPLSLRKAREEWIADSLKYKATMAGTFHDSKDFESITIWRTTDLAELRTLAGADPYVRANIVRPEAFVWMVADGVVPGAK